jgi:hypothetical protein
MSIIFIFVTAKRASNHVRVIFVLDICEDVLITMHVKRATDHVPDCKTTNKETEMIINMADQRTWFGGRSEREVVHKPKNAA